MTILQLTTHYYPNVGGVETHLSDLVSGLVKKNFNIVVLTYRPLVAKKNWDLYEKNKNLTIFRIPWIPGLFYKLVDKPFWEFFYLLPGLFLVTPFVILLKKPQVIHAHGLVVGFVAVFWGKLFNKKVIVSTHSIYHFPRYGMYRNFVRWIFMNADIVSGLSNQAAEEIRSLGVNSLKVKVFTYWLDLNNFRKIPSAKIKIHQNGKFIVLFVGRLVEEKGIRQLLNAAKTWNRNITLLIIGTGPLEDIVENYTSNNIQYLGRVEQDNLHLYYNAADLTIVPSIHEEGFGRVILESLACGTPVVAARRGAIPEAMDETVGKLINISVENIKETIEYYFKNRNKLLNLAKMARRFAERRYSEKNIETIINTYRG